MWGFGCPELRVPGVIRMQMDLGVEGIKGFRSLGFRMERCGAWHSDRS